MPTNHKSPEKTSNQLNNLYLLANPLDTKDKIIIDIKDIIDYSFCPRYYSLKKTNSTNLKELYDNSIHKTLYAYLIALQEDKLESTLEFLKYRWGKEWIKYKTTKDLLVTPSAFHSDYYESYRKRGIDVIFKFNDLMNNDKQYPIIIGHKYQIEILPNIILTGTFEYIRELTIKDKKIIQIVKFITESHNYDTIMSRKLDLELIAMSYAFEEMFNAKEFQIVTIDIAKKKVVSTVFNQKHYQLLKDTVRSTVICLQNNIKCISPDRKCNCCEFRNICMNSI